MQVPGPSADRVIAWEQPKWECGLVFQVKCGHGNRGWTWLSSFFTP